MIFALIQFVWDMYVWIMGKIAKTASILHLDD